MIVKEYSIIDPCGRWRLCLPAGAVILGVREGRQESACPFLLVLEDPLAAKIIRHFRTVLSREALPSPWSGTYLGSCVVGECLGHIFEVPG